MMGVRSMAGPTLVLAASWCLVCCPEAFAREDTGVGGPQGLDVAWTWKYCSWRYSDLEEERQVLKSCLV